MTEMTTGELISFLECFHPDKRVLISIGLKGGWLRITDTMAVDGFPIICIKSGDE